MRSNATDQTNYEHDEAQGSLVSYVTGFILSLLLTLNAYFIVTKHLVTGNGLLFALAALAAVQFIVQLVFFLHLGRESKPRWNLTVFAFMLLVVGIVVVGSLWIMTHLNYHMRSPHDTDTYLIQEENIKK